MEPTAILGADSEIQSIQVAYDNVKVTVGHSSGDLFYVFCYGHIGVSILGFWDEIVVEGASLLDSHPTIDSCLKRLHENNPNGLINTGDPDRNQGKWKMLQIRLIDGVTIDIVAARFSVSAVQ